jgi:hypothetical protein
MGISASAELLREARNKREKSLLLSSLAGKTRLGTLKVACSTDGDGKCSSGVDDLARHEPPSQVLALTLRCHMWLHVAYGV